MTTEPDYSIVPPGQPRLQNRIKWANRFAWIAVEAGAAVGVVGVWIMWRENHALSLNGLSSLGSYLQGSVASLWALAGLLLIYATFVAQRLQLQQQEAELEDQKEQFAAQQGSIKRQNFETSFFQLLNLQNQITAALRVEYTPTTWRSGRDCFEIWRNMLEQEYNERLSFIPENDLGHIRAAYQSLYSKGVQASLGHYFTNLYHVIKFVETSDIEDKRRYTSLVRAQLSAYELVLLFYNCLSSVGDEFKRYVEEFGLLEHLDDSLLINRSHRQLYAASAYK